MLGKKDKKEVYKVRIIYPSGIVEYDKAKPHKKENIIIGLLLKKKDFLLGLPTSDCIYIDEDGNKEVELWTSDGTKYAYRKKVSEKGDAFAIPDTSRINGVLIENKKKALDSREVWEQNLPLIFLAVSIIGLVFLGWYFSKGTANYLDASVYFKEAVQVCSGRVI